MKIIRKINTVILLFLTLYSLPSYAQFNILHPVRSVEKDLFIGVVGYVAIKGTADYLIAHPNTIANWLETHPNEIEPLTNYVDKKITNAQTEDEYNKYYNLKQQLALDQNVNQNQEITIENDSFYQQIESNVRQEITSATITIEQSGRMPSSCNINVVAQLLEAKDTFENGIGNLLPAIQSQPTDILNVGTFKNLDKNYKSAIAAIKLTPDHIPSYGALAAYFKNHGYIVPARKRSNLESNSSAIVIPTDIHQTGSRTYGGRNNRKTNGDTTIQKDANDLLEATILDIATMAFLIYKNPQYNINAINYINNSIVLFERNKLLCMYDVK